MSSITASIQQAVPRNRELLAVLSDSDHVGPALEQHQRHVRKLKQDLDSTRSKIAYYESRREKELKDHEKYRDSVLRRFAFKISGQDDNFGARAEKEKQEYFDILQSAHKATEEQKVLESQYEEGIQTLAELESLAQRHNQAQQELDGLYDSIFWGSNPEFPEEVGLKSESQTALQTFHNAAVKSEAAGLVVGLLGDAQRHLNDALAAVEKTLSESHNDLFGGQTMMIRRIAQRNELQDAQIQATQGQMLVIQARQISSDVANLPLLGGSYGNMTHGGSPNSNFSSDYAPHQEINNPKHEIQKAANHVNRELEAAKYRLKCLEQIKNTKSKAMENARFALQRERERIFERLSDFEKKES